MLGYLFLYERRACLAYSITSDGYMVGSKKFASGTELVMMWRVMQESI